MVPFRMNLQDVEWLNEYSVTRSIARPLCDSWRAFLWSDAIICVRQYNKIRWYSVTYPFNQQIKCQQFMANIWRLCPHRGGGLSPHRPNHRTIAAYQCMASWRMLIVMVNRAIGRCQWLCRLTVRYFNCSVSNSIYNRKTNFLAKLKCSDSVLIGLFSNVISMELSDLQLNYACTWSELDIVHYFIHLHVHFLIVVEYKWNFFTLVTSAARRLALAGRSRTCAIQARRNSASVSATQSPAVPDWLCYASVGHRQ